MITITKYNETYKNKWNSFIAEAKNATFLFNRGFMDYHNHRFNDFSLLCFKNSELIAVLPANRVADIVYSHQGLTYGGLVLSVKSKLFEVEHIFKAILAYLSSQGIRSLELKMIPAFYTTIPSDELLYWLFKAGAVLKEKSALMVIDMPNKLRFKKNRREGINKALRSNLELKLDNNFKDFWEQVLIPNLKNKHAVNPVHSLKEIELLAARFPENIKHINVYKDKEVVAGTTLFLTKTTIHPQYVSGNATKNSYGSLDLLYDFIINKFDLTKRYFDFNISSECNGNVLNRGLVFWKESCGARTFTADTYVINTECYKNKWIELK